MMNTGEVVKFLLNATERDDRAFSQALDLLTKNKINDCEKITLTFEDGSTYTLLVD